jgi:hypothetical protein
MHTALGPNLLQCHENRMPGCKAVLQFTRTINYYIAYYVFAAKPGHKDPDK